MATNFYVQGWTDSCILENPSSYTSPFFIAKHRLFSAYMLHLLSFFCIKSIEVLSESDKLQTCTTTLSGLLTSVRIFARILALGLQTAVHW